MKAIALNQFALPGLALALHDGAFNKAQLEFR
jgi:hypothetical protein